MQWVLDVRVYRAAFVPALLALFVAAFSLQGRPSPARTRAPADAFDPARAYGPARVPDSLLALARAFPERRPGGAGDQALAERVARSFRGAGLRVTTTRAVGRTVDGETELDTVVGVRPGLSDRRIVVLAHRDALGSPAVAELSGTAALLELARIFRTREPEADAPQGERGRPRLIGRDLRKTLVLVSTSGGSGGAAGARAWARATDLGTVDGVLVLGDLASATASRPWVIPWSNGRRRPPLAWQRTVEWATRTETGSDPGRARASAQWARRAVPHTVGEQGEVNRAGLPAVLLQASGERGPAADAAVSPERFAALGRSALRAVSALDEAGRATASGETAPALRAGPTGLETFGTVLPDWAVRLLVACGLAPALLAALDAVFRARRRGARIGAWLEWALAAGLVVPCAWLWLRVLGMTGAVPAPHGPVRPDALTLGSGPAIALASVALAVVGGVLIARMLGAFAAEGRHDAAAGAAGALAGALTAAVALAVWVTNPYAAALLVPAAHLWLGLGTAETRARGLVGWAMLLAGLAAPALVVAYQLHALRADPLELARVWLVAIAGGHVSAWSAIAVGMLGSCFALLVRVLLARRRLVAVAGQEPLRTRGPATYAGPGSLGGTESALRR